MKQERSATFAEPKPAGRGTDRLPQATHALPGIVRRLGKQNAPEQSQHAMGGGAA